ncbi:MAG: hypothetical protein ACE15C_20050 [Phycisphaerae bacterium]
MITIQLRAETAQELLAALLGATERASDECFPAVAHNAYHWEVSHVRGDGSPITIWNFYPTTGKVRIDAHYPGPPVRMPKGAWTLDQCKRAAIKAVMEAQHE